MIALSNICVNFAMSMSVGSESVFSVRFCLKYFFTSFYCYYFKNGIHLSWRGIKISLFIFWENLLVTTSVKFLCFPLTQLNFIGSKFSSFMTCNVNPDFAIMKLHFWCLQDWPSYSGGIFIKRRVFNSDLECEDL